MPPRVMIVHGKVQVSMSKGFVDIPFLAFWPDMLTGEGVARSRKRRRNEKRKSGEEEGERGERRK